MRNVGGNAVSWDTKTFVYLLNTFVRHEFFPSVVTFWRRRSWLFTRSTASRNEDFRVSYYWSAFQEEQSLATRLWNHDTWCYVQWNVHSLTSQFFFSYAGYCWFVQPGSTAASSSASLVQSPKKVTIGYVEFLFYFIFFYVATNKLLKKVKAHQIQIQVTMSTYIRIYYT